MDIQNIAIWVSIISGIFAIIFGKSIYDLVREWQQGRRKRKDDFQNKSAENVSKNLAAPANHEKSTRSEEYDRKKITPFSELIKSGKYQKALANAIPERKNLENSLPSNDLDSNLLLHDFDVWWARALIYTGKTDEGLAKLDLVIAELKADKNYSPTDRLVNEVLARSHNDRGYAYWMDKGHYEMAVAEFNAAIKGFLQSCSGGLTIGYVQGPVEELATAYDNLGRVYVQLGNHLRSELMIKYARKIRESILDRADSTSKARAVYRYALSINSQSIFHLAFGEPYKAQKLSNWSLEYFRSLPEGEHSRGTGLALLSKGQALREIGKAWRNHHQSRKPYFEKVIKLSINTLEKAETFFTENQTETDRIWEPIRLCQIKNEIGCAYRELADLKDDLRIAKTDGARYLQAGRNLAEKGFPLLFLDGCEDLARLSMWLKNFDAAEKELNRAEKRIREYSQLYHFKEDGGTKGLKPKDCIEEFWLYLGKIYALRGHMVFDQNLAEAVKFYTLAMGYFGLFAERTRDYRHSERKIENRNSNALATPGKLRLRARKNIAPPGTSRIRRSHYENYPKIHIVSESLLLISHRVFINELFNKLLTLDAAVIDRRVHKIVRSTASAYRLKSAWLDGFYNITNLIIQTKS